MLLKWHNPSLRKQIHFAFLQLPPSSLLAFPFPTSAFRVPLHPVPLCGAAANWRHQKSVKFRPSPRNPKSSCQIPGTSQRASSSNGWPKRRGGEEQIGQPEGREGGKRPIQTQGTLGENYALHTVCLSAGGAIVRKTFFGVGFSAFDRRAEMGEFGRGEGRMVM
jgi:hypothetical protein